MAPLREGQFVATFDADGDLLVGKVHATKGTGKSQECELLWYKEDESNTHKGFPLYHFEEEDEPWIESADSLELVAMGKRGPCMTLLTPKEHLRQKFGLTASRCPAPQQSSRQMRLGFRTQARSKAHQQKAKECASLASEQQPLKRKTADSDMLMPPSKVQVACETDASTSEEPECTMPLPESATAPAPETPEDEMSQLEKEREAIIAKNNELLQQLGLSFSICSHLPKKPVRVRTTYSVRKRDMASDDEAEPFEPRRSSRVRGSVLPEYSLSAALNELDEMERQMERPQPRRTHVVREIERRGFSGRGADVHQWKMKPLYIQGVLVKRRRSCHVCTQCFNSWRGAFSEPLGCNQCPLIWCTRCLANIFGEDDEMIERLVTQANQLGTWTCFKCRNLCACQAPQLKGYSALERHKKWGWVGVTGRQDPSCSVPKAIALEEEELPADKLKGDDDSQETPDPVPDLE
jgi:hypothetical protein